MQRVVYVHDVAVQKVEALAAVRSRLGSGVSDFASLK